MSPFRLMNLKSQILFSDVSRRNAVGDWRKEIGMPEEDYFDKAIEASAKFNASDIHLTAGCPIRFRINEKLQPMNERRLTPQETWAIALRILKRTGRHIPEEPHDAAKLLRDIDCSYAVDDIARFRVNICFQRGSVALVLRRIPHRIPTIEELNLPSIVKEIAVEPRGLVLVTGMTGSGKSTTIASMIDLINDTEYCKIVTIEDPIEFLHKERKSSIVQREIGSDTDDFARALRASLRQDPDVILVGEMRDEETAEIALKAAETGHLVLSTLHTTDAAKTLNRLISFVTPEEQNIIRIRLADSLKAIISQRLLPKAGGGGLIPAVEVLRSTNAIKECIVVPEKTGNISDYMAKGTDQYGMQTFDQHLMQLVKGEKISVEIAKAAATSAADFERSLIFE